MEKKNKAVCITLTDAEYNKAKEKADQDRRPLAQFIYLLIADKIKEQ